MSGRKLGGGRVLGSGKGLAPPPPIRITRPESPSVASGSGTLSQPDLGQDLASNISSAGPSRGDGAAAAAADARLVCPICNEEMMTLLQLNRHIDDTHQELPEIQQDEVKTWFDKQVHKAKRFQPLSVINNKLRGLEVFESNEPPQQEQQQEPVTRKHWQRPTGHDLCTDPTCGKRLGAQNGNVNCRKCGKLFCDEHTLYQMKLSRSASHEPVRGHWCRVCETCFKSREGYNDHGLVVDHLSSFVSIRRRKVNVHNLEIQRLEKRLTRLTQLLAGGQRNQRQALERSVVAWQDDASVLKCPFCHQEFGSWTLRRHHCRICGRVVCADVQTSCSSEVGLVVGSPQKSLDVRMCRECKHLIFSKQDFIESMAHKPPDQRAYENLRQFERGITLLLPLFQRAAELQEASKMRKRLVDSFVKYDLAARRIRDMTSTSPTQLKLQKNIYAAANSFLHVHMLPLKSLPRMVKGEPASSDTASQTSTLETEEKEYRERLVVLQEQRFMVKEMIAQARGQTRVEEVGALTTNLEELDREIKDVVRLVQGVERQWEGVFSDGVVD